ncbi:P-loop containing nucleoside triphosphate hydrolase protein [Aspergillus lucknowensis]|uniref:P-loop containing nucleoside triphosphate hydrolase protein n=1 Tax=Aspergillus lucknowensis TaxID=176173 RepID=A0ABR4LUA6_9EURO
MFKGLSRWLFGSTDYSILIAGNDASGKTALLYRLKLNEYVTTCPTIGFNVETIEYPKGWHWTMWDVGGCDKIYPLLRHYLSPTTIVLLLHDCTDVTRPEFPDWFRIVGRDMLDASSGYLWVVPTKQEELPERQAFISDLRQMYQRELKEFQGAIQYRFFEHKLSAKTGEGVRELMDEVFRTISSDAGASSRLQVKSAIQPKEIPTSEDELKALIEKEGEEDMVDPQSFWDSFLNADIQAWDHRSHLKAGYIIVLEAVAKDDSIFTTAETFITHLKRLKNAHPDRFRNTEHQTMTIFWLLQLQLAVWNYKIDRELDHYPSWSDFQDVLFHTPSLRNTKLWSLYYTKDRLFSPQARESWVVPDLQQFPAMRPSPAHEKSVPRGKDENSDRLLRFAFTIVQHIQASKLRRGAVIKDALASLQATTIRVRKADSTIPPYSETQAYFWIQVVHAAFQSLENSGELSDDMTEKSYQVPTETQLSFSNFMLLFGITSETWKDYYSSKAWDSVAARMEFVPPDIKPLPNIIGISPDAHKKATM